MNEISRRILSEMQKKELSYTDLSKLTGVSKSTLQRYVTGGTDKIPINRVEAIAKGLGVSAAYLMGWTDEKEDTDLAREVEKSISSMLAEKKIKLTEKDLNTIVNIISAYINSKE